MAILVLLVCYTAFVANYKTLSSNDNLPTKAIPLALLGGDGFDLSNVVADPLAGQYSFVQLDGVLRSAFPIGTGLAATPYYALARRASPAPLVLEGSTSNRFEKHLAALFSAFGVLFIYLAARDLVSSDVVRAGLAIALATATPILSSVSQGLWSFTGEWLFLALAVLLAARCPRPSLGVAAAGTAMGAAFLCRPTALLLAPVVLAFARRHQRTIAPFLGGLSASGLAAALLNLRISGHPLGAYMALNASSKMWAAEHVGERLAGVLFSPSRGFAWFFPATVAATILVIARRARLSGSLGRLALTSGASITALIALVASYRNWWGGYSVGPRLLAETALPSIVICAVALAVSKRTGRTVVLALLALQAIVQFRIYDFRRAIEWNGVVDVDRNRSVLFDWRNSLLAAAFVPGWDYRPDVRHYFRSSAAIDGWTPVDLSEVANARSSEVFPRDQRDPRWHLYLPRLNRESLARWSRSDLAWLPFERENLIRLCDRDSVEIELAEAPSVRKLALVAAWRGTEQPRANVGALVAESVDGHLVTRGLRLGHEVFDPATALAPPDRAIVAGRWNDFDELVRTELDLGRRRDYRRIRLEGPTANDPGCLYVLAVSRH